MELNGYFSNCTLFDEVTIRILFLFTDVFSPKRSQFTDYQSFVTFCS